MRGFWLYVLKEDVTYQTRIKGHAFSNEWLDVFPGGRITLKGSHGNGYAHDGCSPKWEIFDIIIGTPDGAIDQKRREPKTHRASRLHDALYQFGKEAGITRWEADRAFWDELKGFTWRWPYFLAVRIFGWNPWRRQI